MDALEVSLVPGWTIPRRGRSTPDDVVGAILARVRLRLGFDGLIPHLPPLPVVSTLLELCRAVSVLTGRVNQRVLVPLDGDVSLGLEVATRQLRASLRGAQGAWLLDACVVPAEPLVASLVATGRAFIADLTRHDPALAETALVRSLETALGGLGGRVPDGVGGPAEAPTSPTHAPAGGLYFGHDGRSLLTLRLGRFGVEIDDSPASVVADALVQLVRDAITTRDWPPGRQLVPIDAGGHRSFALLRSDMGLALTVVDAAHEPLGAPVLVETTALATAALRCVSTLSAPFEEHAESIARLLRWAQALAQPLPPPAPPPAGWTWPPAPVVNPDGERLPVAGLHHLAWRRAWRFEAPGLARVGRLDDALLVFDDAGLTALERVSGTVRWQRPGLHPVGRVDSALTVDDSGQLVQVRALDGSTRWQTALDIEAPVVDLVASAAGLVAQTDSTLIGVSADGARRWRYDSWYGHILGLTIHGALCWAVAEDGFLHGIRVRDGARQCLRPVLGEVEAGLCTSPAGLVVASTAEPSGRACVAVYDPVDGRLRWRARCEGAHAHGPAVSASLVVAMLRAGDRCAIEARQIDDGTLVWRHGRLSAGRRCRLHAVAGLLCLKSADGAVTALDAATGQVRWRLDADDTDEALTSNTSPVLRRGLLLVPGATLRVVDPTTGRLIQTFDCGELVPDWLYVWPDGDLAIAEDDAVVRYALGGHLALVR